MGPMRWTGDGRGDGVGSAGAFAGEAQRLVDHMRRPTWVSEDPAAHLLPHLEEALGRAAAPLRLAGAAEAADGTYEVDLVWRDARLSRSARRAALFDLVGAIAEGATYVRERRDPDEFVVVTGSLDGDGPFAAHGHTLRLRLADGSDPRRSDHG